MRRVAFGGQPAPHEDAHCRGSWPKGGSKTGTKVTIAKAISLQCDGGSDRQAQRKGFLEEVTWDPHTKEQEQARQARRRGTHTVKPPGARGDCSQARAGSTNTEEPK